MLAARSAWAILETEHTQIRQALAAIAEALQGGHWGKRGPALGRLRQLIESLQSFDQASHRPKGIAVMEAMRGRSPDADRLLANLRQERERDDALLARAVTMLDAVATGDESASFDCSAILAQHRQGMLRQLDQEDTLLRAHAERLLTKEEWSRVVSEISSALYPPRQQPGDAGSGPGP